MKSHSFLLKNVKGGIFLSEVQSTNQTEPVLIHRNNRVATIEFNRPQSMNALDFELLRNLSSILKDIRIDDDIDIVILRGSGKAFSSGGDIKMMLGGFTEKDFGTVMDYINDIAITLHSMPKLTISAIHGAAAGLGLSLALATDYIMVDQRAKIAMNFIGIGLIPDGGAHFFLSERIGEEKAKELIWEGKVLTAQEAYTKELINEVIEEDFDEAVEAKVEEWLQKPIKAMIRTKKILVEKNRATLIKMLELEKHGQSKMRKTEDHKEGIKAFIEKRKPEFKGE